MGREQREPGNLDIHDESAVGAYIALSGSQALTGSFSNRGMGVEAQFSQFTSGSGSAG